MRSEENSILTLIAALVLCTCVQVASGAEYRVIPFANEAEPGELLPFRVRIETLAGDNLIGIGHYSFAINLLFSGNAGVAGSAVSNVAINTTVFDDIQSNHVGAPSGLLFIGTAGVTTDVLPPNPGSVVGEIVELFTFSVLIPQTASSGQEFSITPSEGFLENLTVNSTFARVSPQTFFSGTVHIVPEPSALSFFCVTASLLLCRRGHRDKRH